MMSRKLIRIVAAVVCLGILAKTEAKAPQSKLPKKYTETVTTKTGEKMSFDMVLIPGGTFLMGSPESEPGHKEDEGPQHQVRLDSFYLCTTEVTIQLFMAYYVETVTGKKDFITTDEEKKDDVDAVTGPTPVYGDMTMGYDEKHPAMGMTWYNAMAFCRWLSEKTGKQYRLPTEAEWEYASRAGSTSAFGVGDDPEKVKDYAWYDDNADSETSQIGKKKPNAWGLYDMSGNVREWVYDFYSPMAYKEAAKDPELLKQVAAIHYFDDVTAPVEINYGTADGKLFSGTPPEWSKKAYQAFIDAGVQAELFAYEGEGHSFLADQWYAFMERSAHFFDKYVK